MADVSSIMEQYAYKADNVSSSSVILGKDATQLDMNDFFNLLVAQMTNQDMLNPNTDTEYIAQMAQFTTLSGIQTITEYQLSNYAVSYIGKEVVIANVNENTGAIEQIQGVVSNVTFYNGTPMVIVNGEAYELYTIMEVVADGYGAYKGKDDDGNKTGGTGGVDDKDKDTDTGNGTEGTDTGNGTGTGDNNGLDA